ncbi:hypothetical protein [Rappaport israeli]|uniref:hypothetical protein n=1 Tax=Rappaport israeli TaxID=1839807 RepID=UPI0009311F30|nr:hypothetical protein [Rappaport israeli]
MKKVLFGALVAALSLSSQASDFPKACKELIKLTYEAAEVNPEMKASLEMTEEEMIEHSLEEWEKMSAEDQAEAKKGCAAVVEQMKVVIEAMKAQAKS